MQGFYKNDDGFLVWSADKVINNNFELHLNQKDTYSYPVEGWIWAENEEEAKSVLGIIDEVIEMDNTDI
jgi:hypothetical protein